LSDNLFALLISKALALLDMISGSVNISVKQESVSVKEAPILSRKNVESRLRSLS